MADTDVFTTSTPLLAPRGTWYKNDGEKHVVLFGKYAVPPEMSLFVEERDGEVIVHAPMQWPSATLSVTAADSITGNNEAQDNG